MKKVLSIIFVLIFIISCSACGKEEDSKNNEPKLSQMKSICELAVMDCYYHNVAKFTQEDAENFLLFWTKDKHFWIEYSGVVTLGVDVSLVTMDVQDNNVTITIPPATVQNCEVDESTLTKDSYIVDDNSAEITAEDEVYAFSEAQKKLQETASSDKVLLAEAQQRVQVLLEDYVKNIGETVGKEYNISWKYLDTEGKETDKSQTEELPSETSADDNN